MLSTDQAWQTIVNQAQPLDAEPVPLSRALGRVLRADVKADADSPPFDASAMDGYALRRVDAAQPLRVLGESAAGHPFDGPIAPGGTVRIFTGAPVPADADCVIKQEDVERSGDEVRIVRLDPNNHLRRRGENRRAGETVIGAGQKLSAADLAALASAGITRPEVARLPRCVHLVTGNELVAPDQIPRGSEIRDSNSTLIAGLLQTHGAELLAQSPARDDLADARATIESWPAFDVLLISGGASVGDHDIARPLLEALGFTIHFQALNLRPGKPLVFASRGRQLAFALPGNPVSHWVTFNLFVAPLLRLLQSGAALAPERLLGRIAPESKVPPADQRHTFWPAFVRIGNGGYEVKPRALASSGDSSGLVGANALVVVPPDAPGLDTGASVEFILCP